VLPLFTPKLNGSIDPDAVIVMPSTGVDGNLSLGSLNAAANFLYCDAPPNSTDPTPVAGIEFLA
jgi:hypothetical protein